MLSFIFFIISNFFYPPFFKEKEKEKKKKKKNKKNKQQQMSFISNLFKKISRQSWKVLKKKEKEKNLFSYFFK